MVTKSCVICGKEFDAATDSSVVCSAECRKIYQSNYDILTAAGDLDTNSFLTIPIAPDYEINAKLVCRNKTTKQLLKPQRKKTSRFLYYCLRDTQGNSMQKNAISLYTLAVEELREHKEFWLPIPSLDYRYEISIHGVIRNAKTKHILKQDRRGGRVCMRHNGKDVFRSVADLLWEVHGIIKKGRHRHISCFAENHSSKFFFENLKACARFLATKIYYAVRTIHNWLSEGKSTFGDWSVTFIDTDFADVQWNSKGLSYLANRQMKLDKLTGKN